MNMPLIYHNTGNNKGETKENSILRGSFYGTWDLNADVTKASTENDTSYYSLTWEKEVGKGSWVFHHFLKISLNYPWLMLYLRSNATLGLSGGYHYQTKGDVENSFKGTKFQSEIHFRHKTRKESEKPILPHGHRKLLEEQWPTLQWGHHNGCYQIQ